MSAIDFLESLPEGWFLCRKHRRHDFGDGFHSYRAGRSLILAHFRCHRCSTDRFDLIHSDPTKPLIRRWYWYPDGYLSAGYTITNHDIEVVFRRKARAKAEPMPEDMQAFVANIIAAWEEKERMSNG